MGGGTSAGGGAGSTDYPSYMKDSHGRALDSIWSLVEGEQGSSSPYDGWSSADPNYMFGIPDYGWLPPAAMLNRFRGDFPTSFSLLSRFQTWHATIDNPAYISAYTAREAAFLDNHLTTEILPRFNAGMRDAGSVISSAYAIGKAHMESLNTILVQKLDADANLQHQQLILEISTKSSIQELEWGRQLVALTTEITRIYLACKFELDTTSVEMAAKNRKWDMEVFEYYNHVLGAISGAAVAHGTEARSSAIGGVLSGAAAGAMAGGTIGGPYGAAVGAAGGAALGLLSSFQH